MEELTRQIDGYCERLDPSFWAEPLNAVTNASFLVAAGVMAIRLRGSGLTLGWVLTALLAAIGIGSLLFHTYATVWAAIADVLPIALFILTYIYAANRSFLGWPLWGALAGAAAFLPFAALTVPIFMSLPFFEISAGYWPVPLLIAIYGILLLKSQPDVGRGLLIGAALLVTSLYFRSMDLRLCAVLPSGTHLVWHLLNGLMLGWMIEVYRRSEVIGRERLGP